MNLDDKRVDRIIRFALREDIGTGDITSESLFAGETLIDAVIISRQNAVVCGAQIAEKIFKAVDPDIKFKPLVKDGDFIRVDQEVCFIEGRALSIMKAERTALNFLAILSGVATKTEEMVDEIKGTGVHLYDTRKTVPLHRYLEKYAVTVGGGVNHRKGLWDMVLIKDNHIRAYKMQEGIKTSAELIKKVIRQAKLKVQKNIKIEIEVETLEECEAALSEQPDVVMLDNMSPEMVKKAVGIRKKMDLEGKVLFEVSGGITIENIRDYAETGIEIISSGSITSNIVPVDFSLEIVLK